MTNYQQTTPFPPNSPYLNITPVEVDQYTMNQVCLRLTEKYKYLTYKEKTGYFEIRIPYKAVSAINEQNGKQMYMTAQVSNLKDALTRRNELIDMITIALGSNAWNAALAAEKADHKTIDKYKFIAYYSPYERVAPAQRSNDTCYVCLGEFEEGEETMTICGHAGHHIHSTCYEQMRLQDQQNYTQNAMKCGVCRQRAGPVQMPPDVVRRNKFRRDVRRKLWGNSRHVPNATFGIPAEWITQDALKYPE